MNDYKEGRNKKYQELELKELKDKVNYWFRFYDENIKRFHEMEKLVIKTSLTQKDIDAINSLGKPVVEVNSLGHMVDKERGQFAMNEPGFEISMEDGFMFKDVPESISSQMEFILGNIRHELSNKNNDMLQFRTFGDQLIGGWSAWELVEEYTGKRSMEKSLRLKKTYHPTLTGFDPIAQMSHKGDGEYCFELVPMRKAEFERKFGDFKKNRGFYPSAVGDVSWSYKNMSEQMVVVCYFYHKEKRKTKFFRLDNGKLMTRKEYDKYVEMWKESDSDEILPKLTEDFKYEEVDTIYRYVFSECGVHECKKSKFKYFPYIFVDGDSQILANGSNEFEQFTKPFVYRAKGIQKIKDSAFQTLAYEINSWVQSPIAIPYECIEDLPGDHLNAWLNPQKKSLLAFNQFHKGDKDKPLSGPIPLQKQQTPSILMQFIQQVDIIQQNVMGSSDAQLNNEGPHMSGKAISRALSKASASAKPYVVNNTAAMERVAQIRLSWMEENMLNERIAPVIDDEGKSDMRGVNLNENSLRYMPMDEEKRQHLLNTNVKLNFMADMFKIKVTPGNNVESQKDLALEAMATNAKAFPAFQGLVNEYGLGVLLANMDFKDVDILKAKAPDYMKSVQAQKAEAMKNKPMDPTMARIEETRMRIESEERIKMAEMQLKASELAIKEQEADTKYVATVSKINQSEAELAIKQEEIDSHNARTMVMEVAELHQMNHEIRKDHHTIRMEEGEHRRAQEAHEREMRKPLEEKKESNES